MKAESTLPQPLMSFCWAEDLGGCSAEMSGEHPLSQASFKHADVLIKGLSFCEGQTVVIPKKNFKSNILCKFHNNALSPVDEAGVRAIEALEDSFGSKAMRRKDKIDGILFERWLLKTLINFELLADFNRRPARDVVEIAFGRRSFGADAGLFFIGAPGQLVQSTKGFRYVQLISEHEGTRKIAGGRFSVRGFSFLLMICNLVNDAPVGGASGRRSNAEAKFLRHPHRYQFKHHLIAFSWSTEIR